MFWFTDICFFWFVLLDRDRVTRCNAKGPLPYEDIGEAKRVDSCGVFGSQSRVVLAVPP